MRTGCPIDMKQITLRELCKLALYAKKLISTYAQFRLVLPERLTCMNDIYKTNTYYLPSILLVKTKVPQ